VLFFNVNYILSLVGLSVIFWFIPEKFKTSYIIMACFIGLSFIQPLFTVFLVGLVVFVYFASLTLERTKSNRLLTMLIIILSVLLIMFKYLGNIFQTLFSHESTLAKQYLVPLGISYLSFKLIAFVIDVYRGVIEKPNLFELIAFILFIPMFPAGPIERYQNFAGKRLERFNMEFYIQGLIRISVGYFKKVVIVNFVLYEYVEKHLYPLVTANGVSMDLSFSTVALFLVGSLMYAYMDLSAYADIAIGYGHLYGYRICENMHFPIFRKNLSDYWNYWHISLSHWCRNNIYFPVMAKTRQNAIALFASFIVMGLWHLISLKWTLWGMWHATGVTVYSKWNRTKKKFLKDYKKKHNKPFKLPVPAWVTYAMGMMVTDVYASLGYAFIMMGSAWEAFRLLMAMVF